MWHPPQENSGDAPIFRGLGNSYAISTFSKKRGEIAGLILDLERQIGIHRAALLHPSEIADKAMADEGLSPGDQDIRTDFMRRLHWTLGRLQRDQRLDKIGAGKGVRSRLRP